MKPERFTNNLCLLGMLRAHGMEPECFTNNLCLLGMLCIRGMNPKCFANNLNLLGMLRARGIERECFTNNLCVLGMLRARGMKHECFTNNLCHLAMPRARGTKPECFTNNLCLLGMRTRQINISWDSCEQSCVHFDVQSCMESWYFFLAGASNARFRQVVQPFLFPFLRSARYAGKHEQFEKRMTQEQSETATDFSTVRVCAIVCACV